MLHGNPSLVCLVLGAACSPDDDDDLKDTQLERHAVLSHHDIDTFWQVRGSLIYDATAPTTAALVERSFSLAGLIDAKNRQKMSHGFRATTVAMFCYGDVEERFVKK